MPYKRKKERKKERKNRVCLVVVYIVPSERNFRVCMVLISGCVDFVSIRILFVYRCKCMAMIFQMGLCQLTTASLLEPLDVVRLALFLSLSLLFFFFFFLGRKSLSFRIFGGYSRHTSASAPSGKGRWGREHQGLS